MVFSGTLASGARATGGQTLGVIPQSLVDLEVADHDADELLVTDDMRARKGLMDARSDAFRFLGLVEAEHDGTDLAAVGWFGSEHRGFIRRCNWLEKLPHRDTPGACRGTEFRLICQASSAR